LFVVPKKPNENRYKKHETVATNNCGTHATTGNVSTNYIKKITSRTHNNTAFSLKMFLRYLTDLKNFKNFSAHYEHKMKILYQTTMDRTVVFLCPARADFIIIIIIMFNLLNIYIYLSN
jgi:hypothetical protein